MTRAYSQPRGARADGSAIELGHRREDDAPQVLIEPLIESADVDAILPTRAVPTASLLVLVAEDNAINQLVARTMLLRDGIESVTAHHGREAVEMAFAFDYGAILMDCQMPELDGYEATRRIRADERGERVPIIAMTAHSLPSDRDRCLAAGMDDYISKPFGRWQLSAVMSRWLPGGGEQSVAGPGTSVAPGEPPSRPSPEGPVLDAATIARLREEHAPEMRLRLVEAFELALPSAVEQILTAARDGDLIELTRSAHQLRGSSLMLGTSRLSDACLAIERSARADSGSIDDARGFRFRATAREAQTTLREQLI